MKESEDQSLLHAEEKPQSEYLAMKRQILTTAPVASGCLIYGLVNGFSSALITQLKTSSSLYIDPNIESWLASGTLLMTPCGIIANMFISRKYGRWQAIFWTFMAFILTWMLVFASNSTQMLITSCLLLGLASGLHSINNMVYVAEISDPRYRSVLVLVTKSLSTTGVLLCHILGSFLEWQYLALLGACIAAVALILVLFIPESPYWLATNDQTTKARKIYFWLRNNSPTSATEFDLIIQSRNRSRNEKSKLATLLSMSCLKGFVITLLLIAITTFSGMFVFVYYAHDILNKMVTGVNINLCVVILDSIRIVSSVSSSMVMKMFNRKILFVVSNICVIVCLVGCIICNAYEVPGPIVMCFICVLTIFGATSLSPSVSLMMSEVFPIAVREICNGICMIFSLLAIFALIKTLPYFIINLGLGMTFGIYALLLTVCFITVYFLLPETDSISLPQIEQNLANKKFYAYYVLPCSTLYNYSWFTETL